MRIRHGTITVAIASLLVAGLPAVATASTVGARAATIVASPTSLDFGPSDVDVDGPSLKTLIVANGTGPVTLGAPTIGGPTPGAFRISGNTCTGVTLAAGQRCEVAITPRATADGPQTATLLVPNNSGTNPLVVPLSLRGEVTPRGTFYPIGEQRLLDTRRGVGAPARPIGANRAIAVQVSRIAGVPRVGASAVVLNVTATSATANSYLTVYPTGVPTRPTASSLNFVPGRTTANMVTVPLGADGKVDIYNANGSVDVVADLLGYYASDNSIPNHGGALGSAYQPIDPVRMLDTREILPGGLPGGHYIRAAATWGPEVDSHVKAFVVNVTAVTPRDGGYLTAFNGRSNPYIDTSTLNYAPGRNVPNLAVVQALPCADCGGITGWPSIAVYSSATTHVLVDIVGFFDDSSLPGGLRFTPLTPTRIADSRTGLGVPSRLGADDSATVVPPATVLTPDTAALSMNVTAVRASRTTFLTVWPAGTDMPTVSNLNPATGQTVANAALTALGTGNAFEVYNSLGSVDVVVDVVGRHWVYPGTDTAAGARGKAPAPKVSHGPVVRGH
ncbi:hypothetical protein [Asanoa siamensis]|uniref:ASPM-SPD-2-Hydin domain-containing protein n=1 Tax=Asanoa siamensis TaxID=926357 RepID=A0ABQ4CYZ7_9ACTN|nr:hypothetical protein [Asanoa siamensis]GIF76517.1 hypothetical protein Asi02nite_60350 [Asanoa siamensis]